MAPPVIGASAAQRAEQAGFRMGLLWSAWWLHSGHGADQLSVWLLKESGVPRSTWQRLARREQYAFSRGFWTDTGWR